jgi:hypothetical protein
MAFVFQELNSALRGIRQTLGVRVTFADENTVAPLGTFPAGSIIHGSTRVVSTTFDDSGTDTLKLGTLANDDALCDTTDQDLTAAATYTDVVAGSVAVVLTTGAAYFALYEGQNNDATQGEVDVYVEITLMNTAG